MLVASLQTARAAAAAFSSVVLRTGAGAGAGAGWRREYWSGKGAVGIERVKELRQRSGVSVADCKKALDAEGGDIDRAYEWLRRKGLAKAAAKASRIAAQGLVGLALSPDRRSAALVEVNTETDFVSRNDAFQRVVSGIATVALASAATASLHAVLRGPTGAVLPLDVDRLRDSLLPGGDATVQGALTELVASIGENIQLRRAAALFVPEARGAIGAYLHGKVAASGNTSLGSMAALVALESTAAEAAAVGAVADELAMHVVAASPQYLTSDTVPAADLDRETDIIGAQARMSGKPQAVIDKMISGRLAKLFQEVVLLDQKLVIDPDLSVRQRLVQAAKDMGAPVEASGYVVYRVGEGIEKQTSDFAKDVADMISR